MKTTPKLHIPKHQFQGVARTLCGRFVSGQEVVGYAKYATCKTCKKSDKQRKP